MKGMIMYWDIETGQEISDYELEQRYQDMLDEVYPDLEIAGLTYSTSSALQQVDPIAYRVGLSDYIDSEIGETITEDEPEEEV